MIKFLKLAAEITSLKADNKRLKDELKQVESEQLSCLYCLKLDRSIAVERDQLRKALDQTNQNLAMQARIMESQQKVIDMLFGEKVALCDTVAELREKLQQYEGK
jgi:hypothetical protein